MKIKNLLISLGLVLSVGAGIGTALAVKDNVKEAKADTYTGTIGIKFEAEVDWTGNSTNAAIYFTDDGSNSGWSPLITLISGKNCYSVDYELEFEPTHMQAIRIKAGVEVPTSMSDEYESNHSETEDIDDVINMNSHYGTPYSTIYSTTWSVPHASVRTSKDSYVADKVVFNKFKANSDHNGFESYGEVSLEKDESFKFRQEGKWSSYYEAHSMFSSLFDGGGDHWWDGMPNIDYKGEDTQTFDMYYNIDTEKIWITKENVVAADEWAQKFLESDCTTASTGTKAKWGTHATAYAALALIPGAQDLLSGQAHVDHKTDTSRESYIVRAVQRYDYVLERYGVSNDNDDAHGYQDFMGREASGLVHPKQNTNSAVTSETANSNSMIVIAITISAITLAGIGGYFFLRKRKEDR